MRFEQTTALKKILGLKKRLRIIQGGSSAGKTIGILLVLIDTAQSSPKKMISVVSESLPHLKRGAVRDFLAIMGEHKYFKEVSWNRTDLIYTFENGSKIEFFGADQPGKVRGPRRNILFINEVNNINYETYTQLVIRTDEVIYLDYNPVSEFFVHTEIIPKHEHDFLILTYKDNEKLPLSIVQELESRKDRKGFWKVYGLGEIGEVEGKIYTNWKIIDEIPHEARLERYGLDFGYTNDASVICSVYYHNGGYILDEVVYKTGMSNKEIAETFKLLKENLIIADSAEPKSIDEIRGYGLNIQPCEKGKDSVKWGIQIVQDQSISITKQSVNGIKEYRNYLWEVDKNGKILDMPVKGNDHFLDASRYALSTLARANQADMFFNKLLTEELQTPLKRFNRGK